MQRETAAILVRHALFRRMSQAEKAQLLGFVQEEEIGANTLVFQEGAQGDSMYIVIAGNVLVQREVDDDPVPLAQLLPGESFGEIAALAPGPRLVTAKSVGAGLIARLSHGGIEAFAEKSPQAAAALKVRILEHFLIKVRHLQPLWEALIRQGIEALDHNPLGGRAI